LNPDFAATQTTFNKLEKVNAHVTSKKSQFSSVQESVVETDPDFQVEDIDYDFDDVKLQNEKPNFKLGKTVKIKLVIGEICKSTTQKSLRKLLSPILTKFDHQQQFGLFHSALIVGPWYLEWNNSSLCIPRKCYSSVAMIAADLEFNKKKYDLNDTIEKISNVIIEWNVKKEYSQQNANCQQFIDELCKVLKINLDSLGGPLGFYLNKLREKGSCELFYPISDDLREKLKIKEKSKTFGTHEEIDKFMDYLMKEIPDFEDSFEPDYLLLKSFDRAFWLRNFKNPEDQTYQASPLCCPFKDPTVTTSFKKEWF
jgi:hypothetical protein